MSRGQTYVARFHQLVLYRLEFLPAFLERLQRVLSPLSKGIVALGDLTRQPRFRMWKLNEKSAVMVK